MMPGVTVKEIHAAILDAFDEDELTFALVTQMNVRLDHIVKPSAFKFKVFELIQWADREGRETELVQVVAREKPRSQVLQQVYKKYGLAVPIYVEKAGEATPAAETDSADGGLEKIVKGHLSFAEFGIWRERMAEVEARVCLININDNAQGTGFLVGPDAVLTNYHVMEPLLKGKKNAADFECVFDFKVLADGTRTWTPVKLHATEWNIDSSPFSQAEAEANPDKTDPTADELDYALIKLADAIGEKPWSAHASANGANRGWIKIPTTGPAFKSPMGVLIAQHPAGRPLKLALDTDAINQANKHWLNAAGTRIRYATNTLGGSSGSPVFDLEWNLIALHHYGDPAFNHKAKYNQGVPIDKIRASLTKNGKSAALGA